MAKINFLQKRPSGYYYRRRVPEDLLPFYKGKEIIVNLKTKDPTIAGTKARERALQDDKRFESFKDSQKQNKAIPSLALEAMAKEWFRLKEIEQAQRLRDRAGDYKNPELVIEAIEGDIVYYADDAPENGSWGKCQSEARSVLLAHGYLPTQTEAVDELAKYIKRGHIENLARLAQTIKDDEELFLGKSSKLFKDVDKLSPKIEYKPDEMLQEWVDTYIADGKRKGLNAKSQRLRVTALKLFIEMHGNIPLKSITSKHCRDYYDVLEKLPSRATKKLTGVKSYKARIAKAEQLNMERLAPKTIKHRMTAISAFLNFVKDEDLIQSNPMPRHLAKTEKKKARTLKDSFTLEELKKIFTAPLYTGCVNDENGYDKKGDKIIRKARFWIPLLGLYTGMRANEICQLFVEDIKREEGIDYINVQIDDDEIKKVKSVASIRKVPIHPELQKMGFMHYVMLKREANEQRLFPEIKPDKDGYFSTYFVRWFTRLLEKTTVKHKKNGFHSFRHSARDAIGEPKGIERVDTNQIREIFGWTGGGMEREHYGSGPSIKSLYEDISKIRYPSLDLSHLYVQNSNRPETG